MARHGRRSTIGAPGAAAVAVTSEQASAQSSITPYGVADVSVRYLTNSNAKNDDRRLGLG